MANTCLSNIFEGAEFDDPVLISRGHIEPGSGKKSYVDSIDFLRIEYTDNELPQGALDRTHLVLRNLRLAAHVAYLTLGESVTSRKDKRNTSYRGVIVANLAMLAQNPLPIEDRIQEGIIGLIRAAERYSSEMGAKFSTYAWWHVESSILRALKENNLIHVPINVIDDTSRVRRNYGDLAKVRFPTIAALGDLEDSPEAQYAHIENILKRPLSLERLQDDSLNEQSDEDSFEYNDRPSWVETREASDDASREELEHVDEVVDNQIFLKKLEYLPDRERRIVELRYGLHDGDVWTLEKIGHELGITRERVRQLEGQALSRLASYNGPESNTYEKTVEDAKTKYLNRRLQDNENQSVHLKQAGILYFVTPEEQLTPAQRERKHQFALEKRLVRLERVLLQSMPETLFTIEYHAKSPTASEIKGIVRELLPTYLDTSKQIVLLEYLNSKIMGGIAEYGADFKLGYPTLWRLIEDFASAYRKTEMAKLHESSHSIPSLSKA